MRFGKISPGTYLVLYFAIAAQLLVWLSACQETTTNPPACEEVDYSGIAPWALNDSLVLVLKRDIVGRFAGKVDSLGNVSGFLTGKFIAPLGENSFTREDTLALSGKLEREGDKFSLILRGPAGALELYWEAWEDVIWWTATFCLRMPTNG
jgi:hypothetical protein